MIFFWVQGSYEGSCLFFLIITYFQYWVIPFSIYYLLTTMQNSKQRYYTNKMLQWSGCLEAWDSGFARKHDELLLSSSCSCHTPHSMQSYCFPSKMHPGSSQFHLWVIPCLHQPVFNPPVSWWDSLKASRSCPCFSYFVNKLGLVIL